MTNRKYLLAFVLCASYQLSLAEAQWQNTYGVEVEALNGFSLQSPRQQRANKFRLHLQGSLSHGKHTGFIAVNAEKNRFAADKATLAIQEAYWEWASEQFDLRLGRQLIIWGKADGVAITDVISPKDHREYLAQDYQDTRLPVNALKLRYLGDVMTLEGIWIPIPAFDELPSNTNNPLTPVLQPNSRRIAGKQQGIHYHDDDKPNSIKDSEFALRASYYLSAMDMSLSWFHGHDRQAFTYHQLPIMEAGGDSSADIILRRRYRKMDMLGIDAAIPSGEWVWRLEGAWKHHPAEYSNGHRLDVLDHSLLLAGFDWNPGNVMVTGQYLTERLTRGGQAGQRRRQNAITLSVSKKWLRDTLTLDGSAYIDLDDSSTAMSIEGDYAVDDNWHVATGINFFDGRRDSRFQPFHDLSAVWLKVKFSL